MGIAVEPEREQVATSASLRLELLHGFALWHGESLVPVPANVQRLLAFLAIRHRPQHRDSVAATLWLDCPDSRAAANLRTALWRVRKLCDGAVVVTGGLLALGPEVACDLDHALERAHRLIDGSDTDVDDLDDLPCDAIVGDLGEDLLPSWSEYWVLIERERLRQLRLHALESLCRKMVVRGRLGLAVEVGLAAVAVEPLRESAHRVLVDAYLAENNVGEAVRAYRAFAVLLKDQLGIAPTDELQDRLPAAARTALG